MHIICGNKSCLNTFTCLLSILFNMNQRRFQWRNFEIKPATKETWDRFWNRVRCYQGSDEHICIPLCISIVNKESTLNIHLELKPVLPVLLVPLLCDCPWMKVRVDVQAPVFTHYHLNTQDKRNHTCVFFRLAQGHQQTGGVHCLCSDTDTLSTSRGLARPVSVSLK